MMTAGLLINQIAILLGDSINLRWPRAELLAWINDGQRELVAIQPDAKTASVNLTLQAGAWQGPVTGAVKIIEVRQSVNGAVVTECDRKALDAFMSGWMSTAGSWVRHWMPDPLNADRFYVYPAQGASPASVVVHYVAYPSAVGEGDNLDIRELYIERLLNYVLYRAFSKPDGSNADPARAQVYFQLFAKA